MNLIDILNSKKCPQPLLDSPQRILIDVNQSKSVVAFKDNLIGGVNAVIVTGEDCLDFSPIYNITYHDVSDLWIKAVGDNIKVTCRSVDLDKDIEFILSIIDDVITIGEREILEGE
jgi:hypothetical protein